MSLGLLGFKLGMTQVFVDGGTVEPVTVLQLGPCPVLQIKYPSAKSDRGEVRKDGYSAVQLGFKDKPRKAATRPEQGHVAANLRSKRKEARQKAGVQLPPKADCEPQRHIREFRLDQGGGFVTKAECGPGRGEADGGASSHRRKRRGRRSTRRTREDMDAQGRADADGRGRVQGRAGGGRDRHVEGPRHAGRDEAAELRGPPGRPRREEGPPAGGLNLVAGQQPRQRPAEEGPEAAPAATATSGSRSATWRS